MLLEVLTLQEAPDVFHKLCKLIQRGDKEIIFANIEDKLAKDFIQVCLMDDPEDRPSLNDLMQHKFLLEISNDYEYKNFRINTDFIPSRLFKTKKNTSEKPLVSKKLFPKSNLSHQ